MYKIAFRKVRYSYDASEFQYWIVYLNAEISSTLFSISLFWRDKISSNLINVQWPRKCCKIFFSILDAAINGPHKITLSEAEFALGKIDSENALHFLTLKLLFIILCLNCCAKESAKQLSIR